MLGAGRLCSMQAVVVIPFEPLAPPVFHRGLQWDSDDPTSSGTIALRQRSTYGCLLLLAAVLAVVTVAQHA